MAELQRVLQLDLTSCMLGINNRNLETFEVGPFQSCTCIRLSSVIRHCTQHDRGVLAALEQRVLMGPRALLQSHPSYVMSWS